MSKELFSQVREELNQEKPDAAKVKSILKMLESEENETVESLRFANTESKKRKEKIRDELNPKIEELADEIVELKKKTNTETLETEIVELKKYKSTVLENNKKNFITNFSKVSKHSNFEKVKDKFSLPEPNDKGEYDFTETVDEVIQKNSETLTFLEDVDFFTIQETKPNPHVDGDRFKNVEDEKGEKIETRDDLLKHLKSQIKE